MLQLRWVTRGRGIRSARSSGVRTLGASVGGITEADEGGLEQRDIRPSGCVAARHIEVSQYSRPVCRAATHPDLSSMRQSARRTHLEAVERGTEANSPDRNRYTAATQGTSLTSFTPPTTMCAARHGVMSSSLAQA